MALEPSDPSSPVDNEVEAPGVVAALSVYAEPLAEDARVVVIGNVSFGLAERLLDLGARTVHVYDPIPDRVAQLSDHMPRGVSLRILREEFDVRDNAFDLVVIPDVGALPDPSITIPRLRRVLDARGTVVAMSRARTSAGSEDVFPELAPSAVEYAELYDLFAMQFESVTMNGVLPFTGVVFAELGSDDEDLPVSVDTRLVPPEAPGVFVVVASRDATELDPYSIVQVGGPPDPSTLETIIPIDDTRARAAEAAFATLQLRAELLEAQLDEYRARVSGTEGRTAEIVAQLAAAVLERDVAFTRIVELDGVLGGAQQALAQLERRVIVAEQGVLERDDQIAALNAELDARSGSSADLSTIDPEIVAELGARAERAESSLALQVADLAQLAEAHATETAGLEAQLRERAHVLKEMERELARREHLVKELVSSLEDAREAGGGPVFEAAPAAPTGMAPEEGARLRRKLDELALEIARRDGELQAQAWKITELENANANANTSTLSGSFAAAATQEVELPPVPSSGASSDAGADAGRAAALEGDLAKARDEIDALRQALTQEHAARVAAESGEELSRARAELARQAALLEQLRSTQA